MQETELSTGASEVSFEKKNLFFQHCEDGKMVLVKRFIREGVSANLVDSDGNSGTFFDKTLSLQREIKPEAVSSAVVDMSALMRAAASGAFPTAQYLLRQRASPNYQNPNSGPMRGTTLHLPWL